MDASYQAQNPHWIATHAAGQSRINVISVGRAVRDASGYSVPVVFFARDRHPSPGSDTRCREFSGTVEVVRDRGRWRYHPVEGALTATAVPASDPHCPT